MLKSYLVGVRNQSKKAYNTLFDSAFGLCSGQFVMATRWVYPNNLLTAIVCFSGIHRSTGSNDPPDTRKGRGTIRRSKKQLCLNTGSTQAERVINFLIKKATTLTMKTSRYKMSIMTNTYPICVNISYQGVLKAIIEKILIRNAMIKQVERIYISFFNRLDVMIKSFIFGCLRLIIKLQIVSRNSF